MTAFIILAGVTGLVFGSFYNVCIHRYLTGQSVVRPGSHCPDCGHPLAWWENIPLMSFLALRGRCRVCRRPISWRYPLVEAVAGLWAVLLALRFGWSPEWLVYFAFGGALIVASFIDLELFILPDVITLPGAVLAPLCAVFVLGQDWRDVLAGAAIGSGAFLAIQIVYRRLRGVEGLGTGDVKLMLLLGALIGPRGLPLAVFGGSLLGLAASLFYLRRGEGLRTAIPFGPFLSLGGMLAMLAGDEFWLWYLGQ